MEIQLESKDRYYWKLEKELVIGSVEFSFKFQLHGEPWNCLAFLYRGYLDIAVFCVTVGDHLFNLQTGIVGDDCKEFASLNATRDKVRKGTFLALELIRRSEFESLLLADKVSHLFIEIKSQDVENVRKRKTCTQTIELDYERLLLNGRNSDVTIEVNRRKFNCHKCILGARSPVFAAMMEHDMKEKATGIVTIKDSEPTTFQEFLLYLYTGSKKHLRWKDVTGLYQLANKYDVRDLENLCVEHIKENITKENCCDFFILSQLHNDSELIDATIQFFLKTSKEITESEKWPIFLSKYPIESNVLIKALAQK